MALLENNLRCAYFSPAASLVNVAPTASLCFGHRHRQPGIFDPESQICHPLALPLNNDDIPSDLHLVFQPIKCPRTKSSLSTHLVSFFFFFLFFFLEMAPHYGSPGADQMLAMACTVVGVGPGGNTSMVA
jgi:hypothetical protein